MSTNAALFSVQSNPMQSFPSYKEGYSKRIPNCQKCGQHGRKARLKGHKRVCPYRDCECPKCQVVSERQKLMANQIKMRRRQRKETMMKVKSQSFDARDSASEAANGPLSYSSNDLSLLYGLLAQQSAGNPTGNATFQAMNAQPSLSDTSSLLPLVTPTSISMPSSQASLLSPSALAMHLAEASVPVLNGMDPLAWSEPSSPIRKSSAASDFCPNPFMPVDNTQLLTLLSLLSQQQSPLGNATGIEQLMAASTLPSVKQQPEPMNCAAMAALFAKMCASQSAELGNYSPPSAMRASSPTRGSFVDVCSI
ncbi:DM DNA binding domain-containing protein [Aphelenchoides avenae]|nr:DM DNA binding domain-containing protein [Aphelenchus avenae]